MGKHVHRLSDKNFERLTATCVACGPVNIKVYGNTYRCEVAYWEYKRGMKKDRNGTPRYLKTDTCAACGFVAKHSCQMDLDHIDGDRTNHDPENMETLCSNCHRLKSYKPELLIRS